MSRKRILYVDPDRTRRTLLGFAIEEKLGYEVVEVGSLSLARSTLEDRGPFDFVICFAGVPESSVDVHIFAEGLLYDVRGQRTEQKIILLTPSGRSLSGIPAVSLGSSSLVQDLFHRLA